MYHYYIVKELRTETDEFADSETVYEFATLFHAVIAATMLNRTADSLTYAIQAVME